MALYLRTILVAVLTLICASARLARPQTASKSSAKSSSKYKSQLSADAKLYLENDFTGALEKFQQLDKEVPGNARIQYYLGLCAMRLKDRESAAKYFELMKKYASDDQSNLLADTWLGRIERHQKRISDNYSIPAPVVDKENEPVARVSWFYTNWCPKCKRFRALFDEAVNAFPSVKFEQFNSEDPDNWELVSTYKVRSYPTLVYFGKNGKIIENFAGAPMGNTFNIHLTSLGATPATLTPASQSEQSAGKQGKTK